MQQKINLQLLPSEAVSDSFLINLISKACSVKEDRITGHIILKKSLDARGKQVKVNLTLQVFIDEPFKKLQPTVVHFKDVHHSTKKIIVMGAGPAGLFAAIQLIEAGIKPIIVERGKDVRARRRDLAMMNKEGVVNPESNYCF